MLWQISLIIIKTMTRSRNTRILFFMPQTGESGREDDRPSQSYTYLCGLHAEKL